MTGDAAPDANGTFAGFDTDVVLNDSSQAAFLASLAGTSGGSSDNTGIFRSDGVALTQIVREGDAAPDANGSFAGISDPTLNNTGQTAFGATLLGTSGGGSDDTGIFRGSGGALTQIVREGDAAPDANGTFATSSSSIALNDLGAAAFRGDLASTSGGSLDDAGIFRGDGGALTQIVREGDAAPDANGSFSALLDPVLNNSGQAAFGAVLTGTSGGASDDAGIFRGDGGAVTQIVREGDAAPDANGSFSASSGPILLNDSGQVAFRGLLTGTGGGALDDSGIFRGDGGVLTQIVREGEAAPDANGTFSEFFDPVLNNSGQAAFGAALTGTSGGSSDDTGIFLGSGGALTQIVREGDAAPDANGSFASFLSTVALNDSGQTLFGAALTGTSGGSSDNEGIFLGDGIETLQVIRKGDTLAGSTVVGGSFFSNPIRGNGLNQFGQVAFQADLASGGQAVGLWTPNLEFRGTAGDFQWDSKSNFTLSIAPGEVHNVTLDASTDTVIAGPTVDTTVASLVIGNVGGGSEKTELTLQDGVNLNVTSATTIFTNGTLGGTGTVTGTVSLFGGGTIAPGNSIGTQVHDGHEIWMFGGNFELEVNDFLGTAGADPGWDLLEISGFLTIAAFAANPITIDVHSLTGLLEGDAANFDPTQDYSLTFVQADEGIFNFSEDHFLLDLSGFSNSFSGTFAIAQQGDSLALTYTAATIPEPSTCAIFLLGLLGIGLLVRQRRRARI